MKLTTESGAEARVSSRADLERALAALGRQGNGFAILSRSADAFMQAAETAPGAYAVEYRDGPGEPLFRSERGDLSSSDVLLLFTSYLERTGDFRHAVAWAVAPTPGRAEPLSLDPGAAGDRTARRMVAVVTVGLGLAALALWLAGRDREFLARAVRTTGTVVSIEVTRSGKHDTIPHHWPVVRFETPDGRPHTFCGDVGSTTPEHRVGQRLAVLYDPDDPARARIAGPVPFSNETVLAGILGPLLAITGTGALLLRRARRRRGERRGRR
jgi:hypothetical protein